MSNKQLPSPELLRQLLRYEPDTGKLFWRERPIEMFPKKRFALTWNKRFANTEAFVVYSSDGYKQSTLGNHTLKAHRVIWAMQTGAWAVEQVDHINGVRYDNRWCNLREATRSQNNRNRMSAANSSSKYLGVCFYKPTGKWGAHIKANGKQKFLGYFFSEIEAARAYDAAARLCYGEFANPNFPL